MIPPLVCLFSFFRLAPKEGHFSGALERGAKILSVASGWIFVFLDLQSTLARWRQRIAGERDFRKPNKKYLSSRVCRTIASTTSSFLSRAGASRTCVGCFTSLVADPASSLLQRLRAAIPGTRTETAAACDALDKLAAPKRILLRMSLACNLCLTC